MKVVITTIFVLVLVNGVFGNDDEKEIRQLLRVGAKEDDESIVVTTTNPDGSNRSNKIIPFRDICPEDYPPKHAMLHDRRKKEIDEYENYMGTQVREWNGVGMRDEDIELPEIVKVQDYKYAVWSTEYPYESQSSAWNNEGDYVGSKDGSRYSSGWIKPNHPFMRVYEVLDETDEWVGFSSWFVGNYGHFVHDHLPTISYLRSVVPETAKFLLIDSKVARSVLKTIDPDFYNNRIKWIKLDEVYYIKKGTLTLAVRHSFQITLGCCNGFDSMRQWIAQARPHMTHNDNERDHRLIVYYSRQPHTYVTSKTMAFPKHGRVMERNHEGQVLKTIIQAMQRHNLKEEFVIFNGKHHNSSEPLPMELIFNIFRNAKTIIGPHGTGIGGNFAWTNPFPTNCAERTQILEFIPGTESVAVANTHPFTSYYNIIRKWPLDYHNIVYSKNSTLNTTYIDLDDLNSALDYMWGGGDPSSNSLLS